MNDMHVLRKNGDMIKIARSTTEKMSFSEKVLLGVRMTNRKLVEEATSLFSHQNKNSC